MAMPQDFIGDFAAIPTYIIYREDPTDLTSAPIFFPAKDSDELFDALRAKYPTVSTHSERMRDAIIEFLIEERNAESQHASPMHTFVDGASSAWQSGSSVSASTPSFNSSPELFNIPTPTSQSFSPFPHAPALATRQNSAATSTSQSPQSLDQMTGVFSVTAGAQPKQRTRRKMTEAEKIEYRNRRIVKACDKCAKRKRKCHHNQPATTELPTTSSKVTHRIQKSVSSSGCLSSSSSAQVMKSISTPLLPHPQAWNTAGQVGPIGVTATDEQNAAVDDALLDFDFSDYSNFASWEINQNNWVAPVPQNAAHNTASSPRGNRVSAPLIPDFELFDSFTNIGSAYDQQPSPQPLFDLPDSPGTLHTQHNPTTPALSQLHTNTTRLKRSSQTGDQVLSGKDSTNHGQLCGTNLREPANATGLHADVLQRHIDEAQSSAGVSRLQASGSHVAVIATHHNPAQLDDASRLRTIGSHAGSMEANNNPQKTGARHQPLRWAALQAEANHTGVNSIDQRGSPQQTHVIPPDRNAHPPQGSWALQALPGQASQAQTQQTRMKADGHDASTQGGSLALQSLPSQASQVLTHNTRVKAESQDSSTQGEPWSLQTTAMSGIFILLALFTFVMGCNIGGSPSMLALAFITHESAMPTKGKTSHQHHRRKSQLFGLEGLTSLMRGVLV